MKPNDEKRTNMKDQNYAAMSEHVHVDGVYPFPAVMQTRRIETNGASIHVRVGGHGPAVVMLPGVGPWDQITRDPAMWHFGFGGQDMERLVAGRERIYLDRFWNELSWDQKRFDEAKRQHYAALYAQPGAMRAGFAQFRAFSQDATDNRTFLAQGKLQMPVLAFGGEATFGPMMGAVMRCVADNVEDVIIPDCGHWITEEQPAATTKLVVHFLHRRS